MGLTSGSTGRKAVDGGLVIHRETPQDRVIALAGNPNVGKSTVFNGLTGMNQHTGNWPGKTVANAQGRCEHGGRGFVMVDIPGSYSLMAHSAEEEVARDFICFGDPDAVVVVCDATCLERNLNLVLQFRYCMHRRWNRQYQSWNFLCGNAAAAGSIRAGWRFAYWKGMMA